MATTSARPSDADWTPWIALRLVRGVGPMVYHHLLRSLGDPTAIFAAGAARLEGLGLRPEVARAIVGFADHAAVQRQLDRLDRCGGRLLTWADPDYPSGLRQIADPPPFLFVVGRLDVSDNTAVAVVGSRSPSLYGRQMTRMLCEGLARFGITVVSGLARGIDGEAHAAALRFGGRTIAVLGSGIDVVYPPEHHSLFRAILDRGAIMSEFLMGVGPDAENFPSRNRIISGATLGTVVVEATERSGSLITARQAAEQGREVFAVPGPIGERSRGPHLLIKQGAKLTERVEDIVEEIAPQLLAAARAASVVAKDPPTPRQQVVLDRLGEEPLHVDDVIARTGLEAGAVLEALLGLELKGWVHQWPGKRFTAAERSGEGR